MIIVRLRGGLGNQCFQYAVGRHLAEIHHSEFKIDISGYENYKPHKYCLNHFNITAKYATADDVAGLRQVKEKHFHFDPEVLLLFDGICFEGYCQSEKYFVGISDIIHQELSVKYPLSGKNKEMAEQILSSAAVGVHIRRADYMPNTYAEQLFEPCSLDYYMSAVKHIAEAARDPHFFIFTDDKTWARENFRLPYPVTLVNHNGPDKNYEDMRLMSLCKHNIIANSSFSWWGAWLNKNPGKIVFAPKKWFTDKARSSPKDIIPEAWLRA